MKALVGAFNQEKALVGAFSVNVQPVVEPMDRFTALIEVIESSQAKEIQDLRGIYDREIGDLKAAIKTMQVSSLPRSEAYSFILNTGFEGAFIK